jgi:gliding motility-associated-like protein
MKRIIVLAIISVLNIAAKAQNLVPNGGFEEFNNCPTNWAQIDYSPGYVSFPTVKDWVSPLEKTTPDYYNACAPTNSKVNIPQTFLGYHDAHNGNGCAGLIPYNDNISAGEYREYIQAKLTQPLIAGHKHELTFYVSTNYNPSIAAYNYIAVDRVGAAFTTNQVSMTPDQFLMLDYQVVNAANNFISSTNSWVKITGTFIAQGGEEWIIIGSFKNSTTPMNKQQLYPATPGPGEDYSYIYVDDVTLTDLDKVNSFTAVHDTAVCVAAGMTLTSPVISNDYTWSTGDTTRSIVLSDSGTYWCMAKNGNNEYTDTFHVRRMYFYPGFTLGPDTLICSEDGLRLGWDLPLVKYYNWSTGSTNCCITPTQTGTYHLTMSNGCDVLSDTIQISAVSCENCFWAPNAFTPNGDGNNDMFGVKQQCLLTNATFIIYDRWGNEVFSTTDMKEKWDGMYNGMKAPMDTYTYMVEYWLLANKPRQVFKGNFILIR